MHHVKKQAWLCLNKTLFIRISSRPELACSLWTPVLKYLSIDFPILFVQEKKKKDTMNPAQVTALSEPKYRG